MSIVPEHAVFIDPSSEHFLENKLFDKDDAFLNRDGTLLPFVRMKEALEARGIPVHTADRLRDGTVTARMNHYWSLGLLDSYTPLLARSDVRLRGFLVMEPALVAPHLYRALPKISQDFESVWLHNVNGDGYSTDGVDASKLHKFFWPQPYPCEQQEFWSKTDRSNRWIVIAGNHNPRWRMPEFYSRRIEAVAELTQDNRVDLYGRDWDKWWSIHSAWLPYWLNRRALMQAYRGTCVSKLEILSRYHYSLCYENTPVQGFITEKIFDCFYAGTVPVYLGAPDIDKWIPSSCYIDARRFNHVQEMWDFVQGQSDTERELMKWAGRDFLSSSQGQRYFNSIKDICGDGFEHHA